MRVLTDTHCHLNMPPLGEDPAGVLVRAAARGVGRVIIPAYDQASWESITDLAISCSTGSSEVYFALGIHPWAAADIPPGEGLALATRLAQAAAAHAGRLVALGEIGLDTKIDLSRPGLDLPSQQRLLAFQLAVAADLDLPVILHCRGAFEELLTMVRAHGGRLRGVLHAFSRSKEVGERFLQAGLHLGLGGAITRPNARKVRRAAAELPLERLVLETDAPSIGVDGVPPEDTEPAHVADVARALAELRGVTLDEVARATGATAGQLFGLGE